jgi:beta-lactamase regulating signal transducer with metallopeptidase domain
MNALFEPALAWRDFYGVMGLVTTLVVACLSLAQVRISSPSVRRTLWQGAFLGLGLLAVVELSGSARLLPQPFHSSRSSAGEPTWLWTMTSGEPRSAGLGLAEAPVASPAPQKTPMVTKHPAVEWPLWLWWAGFFGVSLWFGGARLLLVIGFRRRRRVSADPGLRRCVEQLTARLGWRRGIRVEEIQGLVSPIAYGIFRPAVGLPPGFPSEFGDTQRQAMLAHELAHLVARDPFWQAAADVVTTLLWWHPLVWVARRHLRAATESAADEASLIVDNGPEALAESLVELGARVRQRSVAWLGVEAEFRSDLGNRVTRLWHLRGRRWQPWRPGRSSLLRWSGALAIGTLTWFGTARTGWVKPSGSWQESFGQSILGGFFGMSGAIAAEPPPPPLGTKPPEPVPRPGGAGQLAAAANQSGELFTRWYKTDEGNLRAGLRAWLRENAASARKGAGPNELVSDLLQYLALIGVDSTQAGRQFLYNGQSGSLMARATLAELDLVESAIQTLNANPAQVLIEVRLCEIADETLAELSSKVTVGQPLWALLGEKPVVPPPAAPGSNSLSCILTREEFRQVMEGLEQQRGVNILSAPRITTVSGRQAQIKAVNVRYVVTDLDFSTNRPAPGQAGDEVLIQPVAQPFELGPVVDLLPNVWADNQTIGLTVLASVKEFLGYDEQPDIKAAVLRAGQPVAEQRTPLPRFRLRQLQTFAAVNDGQTLVLAGNTETETFPDAAHMRGDHPPARPSQPERTKVQRNKLVVFVTPRLIDPAGNAIHGTPP